MTFPGTRLISEWSRTEEAFFILTPFYTLGMLLTPRKGNLISIHLELYFILSNCVESTM